MMLTRACKVLQNAQHAMLLKSHQIEHLIVPPGKSAIRRGI
jgi:hypothetical protein